VPFKWHHFVHPGKVPQMADAEAVIDALPPTDTVAFSDIHKKNLCGMGDIRIACRYLP
jgi:hypothetical protein